MTRIRKTKIKGTGVLQALAELRLSPATICSNTNQSR